MGSILCLVSVKKTFYFKGDRIQIIRMPFSFSVCAWLLSFYGDSSSRCMFLVSEGCNDSIVLFLVKLNV